MPYSVYVCVCVYFYRYNTHTKTCVYIYKYVCMQRKMRQVLITYEFTEKNGAFVITKIPITRFSDDDFFINLSYTEINISISIVYWS